MAPTLTSNSFLLTTAPRSRQLINHHNPKLIVFAKRAGTLSAFRLGKQDDPSSTGDTKSKDSNKPNNFFFDIANISDVKSLIPVVSQPSSGISFGRRKDPGTVFVAGATGQAGIRIAQTLLRQGFTVRAGVPDLDAAQELARVAASYKIISPVEAKRLNAVESTFEDAESIAKAMGNASKVVVTIGPTENGPTSEVTTTDALQVVQASQLAGVGHVAIVYDDRAMAPQSTYNVLDGISSFFTNLFSKSQPLTAAEFLAKVVETTEVKYTMIKTSLTDDYSPESAYNVVVSKEQSTRAKDYKVSKSQIASLVADVFSNTGVAENKVIEVSTNPSAPSKPVDDYFRAIPEDGRRKAYEEALAKAKADEEAIQASEKARKAAEATKKLEDEVKKLSEQEVQAASLAQDAQKKAYAAGATMEDLLSKAQNFGAGFSWEKLSLSIATAVQKPEEEDTKPKVQIATIRGVAKAKKLPAKKAVIRPPSFIPKEVKSKQEPKTPPQKEVRKVFGGLFKQETIYIDDD